MVERLPTKFLVFVALFTSTCTVRSVTRAQDVSSEATSAKGESWSWWNFGKPRRTFIPGKGYTIEGQPGYFDESGQPIGKSIEAATLEKPQSTKRGSPWLQIDRVVSATGLEQVASALGQARDEVRAQDIYDEGEALFRKKQFQKAAKKYNEAAKRWPQSALEQDALFMQAESLFFADEYPSASDTYDLLLKKYPSTARLDNVISRQFAIARYWQQYSEYNPQLALTPNLFDSTRHHFDTLGHALRTYENIRMNDPTGPLADDSLMATASAHFARHRYDDADYHYQLLRQEYPKSEHQFLAHLLGLQSKLHKYQGPDYDGTVLAEAQELADQLLTQFSYELGQERERLQKMRAEVAAQLAMRDWTVAEYYAKGQHYGAARFYYQRIMDKHPETMLASRSHDRLVQFKLEPDTPAQQLEWLVNLFPDSTKETTMAAIPLLRTFR